MSESPPWLDEGLINTLRKAQHVVVLTGAGISAESGIATFRDAQTGLWSQFDAEALASPAGFARDPQRVWDWYAERREAMRMAQPNPGHRALVEIEQRVPQFTLITQNIDGLHTRAGSRNVLEIHGNLMQVKCSRESTVFDSWPDGPGVPVCPKCGALLRPNVVWFGEMLPADLVVKAQDATFSCDLFLAIGTSGLVTPAASFPLAARGLGATLVEINPDPTPLTKHAKYALAGPAGIIIPALAAAAWE